MDSIREKFIQTHFNHLKSFALSTQTFNRLYFIFIFCAAVPECIWGNLTCSNFKKKMRTVKCNIEISKCKNRWRKENVRTDCIWMVCDHPSFGVKEKKEEVFSHQPLIGFKQKHFFSLDWSKWYHNGESWP